MKMRRQPYSTQVRGATEDGLSDRSTRAMIFIDGTWLYYSLLRGRDARNGVQTCPVKRQYGEKWHSEFRVAFEKFPSVIANLLSQQLQDRKNHRCFVDVVRTYAFTSTFANTTDDSQRSEMIRDWHKANYDVTHLLTLGATEKCVDISLAVEMLSMATVPNAYDIAVIVTGDKDFIPAMAKTRMKGKNVALVSMRNSVNTALYQPPAEKDFDVIWLEDTLDDLLVPKFPESFDRKLIQLIRQEIRRSGGAISSRELGRTLRARQIDGYNALATLKAKSPGLRVWLEKQEDSFSYEYMEELGEFDFLIYDRQETSTSTADGLAPPVDYAACTVVELKELLREQGLPLSGIKAELVERLNVLQAERRTQSSLQTPSGGSRGAMDAPMDTTDGDFSDPVSGKVLALMEEHLSRQDDFVSSNEMGLVLQGLVVDGENALKCVKRLYGSLRGFISSHENHFIIENDYTRVKNHADDFVPTSNTFWLQMHSFNR